MENALINTYISKRYKYEDGFIRNKTTGQMVAKELSSIIDSLNGIYGMRIEDDHKEELYIIFVIERAHGFSPVISIRENTNGSIYATFYKRHIYKFELSKFKSIIEDNYTRTYKLTTEEFIKVVSEESDAA